MFLLTFHKTFRLTQNIVTTRKSLAHTPHTEDLKLSVLIVFSPQNFAHSPCCVRLINLLDGVSESSRGV